MLHDLVARRGIRPLAHVTEAEGSPGEHTDRTGLGPVQVTPPGSLEDLSFLVFRNHSLDLHELRWRRGVEDGLLERHRISEGGSTKGPVVVYAPED